MAQCSTQNNALVASLLNSLSGIMNSAAFVAAHRVSPGDFTRKRKLSAPTVMGFLMQLVGGQALQESLDGFFMALVGQAHVMRHVTKSAFGQARKKLRATAFSALNREWVQGWLEGVGAESWCGLRVLAADGCCLRLPARAENCVRFGPGPQEDGSVPMARCVGLYAVAARQFLEMVVGRYDQGERGLLLQALGVIKPGDVLVLDRGYPARWLFAVLHARGVNYCVRIEGCGWTAVQALVRSRDSESVVSLKLTGKDRQHWADHGQPGAAPSAVKVRLVKVMLPNGKLQIMATSLMDTRAYPAAAFGDLYRKRWCIEEAYKLIKQRQHLEGFSGELPDAIEQEIQAKILVHNITLALCHSAGQQLGEDKLGQWQVNRAYALKQVGAIIINSVKGKWRAVKQGIRALADVLAKTLEQVRPNRSFPRNHAIGGAHLPRRAYR